MKEEPKHFNLMCIVRLLIKISTVVATATQFYIGLTNIAQELYINWELHHRKTDCKQHPWELHPTVFSWIFYLKSGFSTEFATRSGRWKTLKCGKKYGNEKKSRLLVLVPYWLTTVPCRRRVTVFKQCESRLLTHWTPSCTNTVVSHDMVSQCLGLIPVTIC